MQDLDIEPGDVATDDDGPADGPVAEPADPALAEELAHLQFGIDWLREVAARLGHCLETDRYMIELPPIRHFHDRAGTVAYPALARIFPVMHARLSSKGVRRLAGEYQTAVRLAGTLTPDESASLESYLRRRREEVRDLFEGLRSSVLSSLAELEAIQSGP